MGNALDYTVVTADIAAMTEEGKKDVTVGGGIIVLPPVITTGSDD